ncbi:MAG: 6-bladed beta-propeller, partial [Bacteroidaceae bacterium]|nr:6-bladed beta-propeller [Bacteroidaceae bacterium]
DNLDQVRRNVTEAKVKFPEKQAELLKLLDEMGEDDNPIIAFYKLKD